MYEIIKNLLTRGNSKSIVKWNKFINDANTKLNIYKERFLLSDVTLTKSLYLLKNILVNVDIPYLLKLNTDIERYSKYIIYEIDNLRKLFDPVYIQEDLSNVFVKSTNDETVEFVLNVSYDKPMLTMPLDEGWNEWKKVKPVNILYYDSNEFPILTQYQLTFSKDNPEYAVSSINIATLILKFVHYLKNDITDNLESEFYHLHINDYLKTYVFSMLFEDILNICSTNIIINTLDNDAIDTDSFFVGAGIKDAVSDLQNNLDKVKTNNVTINDFCHTKFINNKSIVEILTQYDNNMSMPEIRQYTYLTFMRDLPYIFIICSICNNDSPVAKQIKLKLRRVIRLYQNRNILNSVSDPMLRLLIENKLDRISLLLN